jgi:hypothetical protein
VLAEFSVGGNSRSHSFDALRPDCRLIGICGHAPKVSRGQRIPWTLMDRKTASHLGHVVWIGKNFGSIQESISSEPFINLMSDCLRGGLNLRFPTFLLSGGHSAFADQRMARFSSRFQYVENPLLCPSEAKGAHFAGKIGDFWLEFVNLRRRKTVWWTKSKANHSPPPNSANKPELPPVFWADTSRHNPLRFQIPCSYCTVTTTGVDVVICAFAESVPVTVKV